MYFYFINLDANVEHCTGVDSINTEKLKREDPYMEMYTVVVKTGTISNYGLANLATFLNIREYTCTECYTIQHNMSSS